MQTRNLVILICLAAGLSPQQIEAQRASELPRLGVSALPSAAKPFRPNSLWTHTSPRSSATADLERPRHWPLYALGGAVLGGATVTVLAVKNCDQGCRDDGALSFLPPYIAIGALIGGILGALVGLAVDAR
jgi:hypothetical protein